MAALGQRAGTRRLAVSWLMNGRTWEKAVSFRRCTVRPCSRGQMA